MNIIVFLSVHFFLLQSCKEINVKLFCHENICAQIWNVQKYINIYTCKIIIVIIMANSNKNWNLIKKLAVTFCLGNSTLL